MKLLKLFILFLVSSLIAAAQNTPVVIRAGTLLDGKGHALHNVLIVVQDGKIARVEQNAKDQRVAGSAFYDLTNMTALPGGSMCTITSPGILSPTVALRTRARRRIKRR